MRSYGAEGSAADRLVGPPVPRQFWVAAVRRLKRGLGMPHFTYGTHAKHLIRKQTARLKPELVINKCQTGCRCCRGRHPFSLVGVHRHGFLAQYRLIQFYGCERHLAMEVW